MDIERLQQRRDEASRRAEPGAGRNVRQCRDLDLRRLEAKDLDRLANDRMLDLIDQVDVTLAPGARVEDVEPRVRAATREACASSTTSARPNRASS